MYIYIYACVCGLGGPHMGFPALNLLGPGPRSFGACRPICRQQNRSIVAPAGAWHRPHAHDPV